MALLTDSDNEGYYYTGAGLPVLNALSACYWWQRDTTAEMGNWCMFTATSGHYIGGFCFSGAPSNYEHFSGLGTHVVRTVTTGAWYFFAVTINGTTRTSYYANQGDTTLTSVSGSVTNSTAAGTELNLGFVNYFGDYSRGRLAHFRLWGAVLSQSELEAEMASATAVRASNLTNEYRFASGALTTDSSGNGRTLTSFSFGTPTFTADPTFTPAGRKVDRVARPRGGLINSSFY